MADKVTLSTQPREKLGSRDADRLRKHGRTPAVIYGHKEAVESVSVNTEELETALRHHVRSLELQTVGRNQTVLIQDIQRDHLGKTVLHIDFRRVSQDERVHVTIDVELRGHAPGAGAGGVLDQPLHSLHAECPAGAVPDAIRVRIDHLQVGQAIHVKDLQLPEGVTILHDPDAIVVQVQVKTQPTAEAAAVPIEGGPAEPEVITAKKPKEGEEE